MCFQFVLFYRVVTNLKSQSVKTGLADPGGKLDSLTLSFILFKHIEQKRWNLREELIATLRWVAVFRL